MRDFKFRVWSNTQKLWANKYLEVAIGEYGEIYLEKPDEGMQYVAQKGMFEINQYTGLKDVNGKDIYEGDILRVEKGNVIVIEWDETMASFMGTYKNDTGYEYRSTMLNQIELWGEVIGNTYENPDLL